MMAFLVVPLGVPQGVMGQERVAPIDRELSTAPITAAEMEAIIKGVGVKLRTQATPTVDATKWPELVVKYREELDTSKTVSEFLDVVNFALGEYGVSGLKVVSTKTWERRLRTSQVGIGIKHSGRTEPLADGLVIDQVIGGGPAEKAGVQDGDTILKVDGVALTSTEPLRGEEGSVIVLAIRRGAAAEAEKGKVEDITVTRGKFRTRDPESFVKIDKETAFIRIPSFDNTYDRRRVESLFKEAVGSRYLVIDLRSNGGGATSNLGHFLGLLLERGTEYGTSVSSDTAEMFKEATGKDPADILAVAAWSSNKWKVRRNPIEPFAGKVAVLVNRATAFEAEIAAAALNEMRVPPALFAGGRTAGVGMIRKEEALASGEFRMTLPVAEYITIKGRRLENNPLKPDVAGPFSLERVGNKPESDELVVLAVKELKKAD